MMLSGKEIQNRLGSDIFIEPFNEAQINPNSYNLMLHDKLLVYKNNYLDMKAKNEVEEITIPDEGFILQPGELYLGRTVERTKTLNLVPMLNGRSSVGRLGIFIHITAGFGDIGFDGYWTLELCCIKPVRIYPNVKIGQIYYHTIDGEYENYKSNKYQNNTDVQASMLYKEYEKQR